MQENIDNLPRNLLFMITLVVSAIAAFFLNSSLFTLLRTIFGINVKGDFTLILERSELWSVASYWSTFALLMFLCVFFIPAVSNIVGLVKLKGKIAELPRASDDAPAVTKDKFLKVMSDFKLVYAEFAIPYAAYIVEKKEKNIRKKTKFLAKGKTQPVDHPVVSVLIPASQIFHIDRVLNSRLSVWFFRPMPRVLMGIGFLLFILSFAGALHESTNSLVGSEIFLMGVSSFSLCMGMGVFLTALYRITIGHVHHRASEVVKMIENLFDYKPDEIGNEDFKSIGMALNKTVSSFKDVSKTINEQQEEAVNTLINKTMEGYVKKISEAATTQSKALQKMVNETSKQSSNVSKELTKRFDEYAEKIADIQSKIDTHQDKSFDALGDKIEKLITSLNEEVSKASVAALHKDAILDDLNKTASDLGEISKASDTVADKFDAVSDGLERLIEQVEKIAPMSEEKRDKISGDIENLKKESDKTVGMGRRAPTKSRKKA